MLDFHEKRKLKSYLYSRTVAVVLCLLAIPLAFSVYDRFVAERKVAHKRAEAVEELEALKDRAAVLEAEVARLRSPRGIEEEIRDRFEVSKAGEHVVVLLGEKDATGTDTPEVAEDTPQDDGEVWWRFWE